MTEQEKTLCEALSFARIEELPAEATGGDWKRAIALVTKATNRQSYVIAKNVDGEINIIKDFGAIASIISIDKIFPYEGESGAIVTPEKKAPAEAEAKKPAQQKGGAARKNTKAKQ